MTVPSVIASASTGISGASTVNLTITGTANVDDVIYISVSAFNGGTPTTTVSCTGSTNAQVRTPLRPDLTIRLAWATISTLTVNPVFTMNFSSGMNGVIGGMIIRGAANPTAPFDVCPGLPMMRGSTGSDSVGNNFGTDVFGNSVPFTTYNNDSLCIFSAFANNTTPLTPPSGFTGQISQASNSILLVATLDAPTPLANLRATTSNGPNQRCTADAIAGQTFAIPITPYVTLCTSAGGNSLSTNHLTFIGTVLPGDVVYVVSSSFNGATSIVSASCTGSSNATPRHSGFNPAITTAWGTITSTTVNPVFTLNYSGSGSVASAGIVVRGAGVPNNPFDPNVAIPTEWAGATGTWTTTQPNNLLIWGGFLNNGNNEFIPPAGWKVFNWDYSGPNAVIATLDAPTAVTAFSATGTGSISGLSPFVYADAITGYDPGLILQFNGTYTPPSAGNALMEFNPGGPLPPPIPFSSNQNPQMRVRRIR